MLSAARSRAKKRGVPFNLTVDDFDIPDTCPALGIEIVLEGDPDRAPSLDRIMPAMGYVKGNVIVLSNRANRIKNNASAHELRQIAEFLETHIKTDWMKP
jgi:dihydroxyacetone kinase-like predicted kinase